MPASKGQALRVLRSLDSPSPLTPVALMTGGVPSHAKRARGHHKAAGTNGDTVPVLLYRSRFAFKTAILAMGCAAISLERFSSTMAKMAASLAKRGSVQPRPARSISGAMFSPLRVLMVHTLRPCQTEGRVQHRRTTVAFELEGR